MLTAVLIAAALGHLVLGQSPQVTTSRGTMKGQVLKSRDGRDFFSFTRIPYAKPPVGERRFVISEKADNWTGILDATQPIPSCYQSGTGQEDCLYLNVFSPNLTGRYPVIFGIHGGGFVAGSAGYCGSAEFFMDEDVVFVAPNYRLGIIGFLSLVDNVIPGNTGIKDQALALEWVHKEISAFGGDPNRITVIGQSAGGASSDFVCSAPRTNGLIKACVSQSGVGSAPWSFTEPGLTRQIGLNVVKAVGCSENGDILKCLQSIPIEQVCNNSLMVDNNKIVHLPSAVLEPVGAPGALLTSWPTAVNHSFPWIIGVCQDEGLIGTAPYEYNKTTKEETEKFINTFDQIITTTLHLENRTKDALRVKERYLKIGDPIRAIRNYYTEAFFVYPALKSLSKYHGSTYFYKVNFTKGPGILIYNISVSGSPHAAELPYFFVADSLVSNPNWAKADDIALSKQLVKMWVNFARDQIPNSQGTVQWPKFQGQYYLDIQDSGLRISNWTDYQEILDFWKSIFPDQTSKSSTNQLSLLFVAALCIISVYKIIL